MHLRQACGLSSQASQGNCHVHLGQSWLLSYTAGLDVQGPNVACLRCCRLPSIRHSWTGCWNGKRWRAAPLPMLRLTLIT